jgi:integrase
MAKALTPIAIANLKPEANRREIPDGGCRGLYLIVQPTGRKVYAVRYRFGDRPRKLTLDSVTSLAEARKAATAALADVERGVDPGAMKLRTNGAGLRGDDTVERLADDFIARYAKKNTRPNTWKQYESILNRIVKPAWRGRMVRDIARRDCIELVESVAADRPIMANRVIALLSCWFNWLVDRDVVKASPAVKIKSSRSKERPRKRFLSDEEIKRFLVAVDALSEPFGDMYWLLLLTGRRRQEVGELTWGEYDRGTWLLADERNKSKVDHSFLLSRQARAIIERQPRVVGSPYVFGCRRSGWSHFKPVLDAAMNPDSHWVTHDLRRTITAGMQRLKIDERVSERVLGHVKGGIVGVYHVYEYHDEKAAAYQQWADHVDTLAPPRLKVVA